APDLNPPSLHDALPISPEGFQLTFTQPMQDSSVLKPDNYQFSRYYYLYHSKYGSPQQELEKIPVTGVKISDDRKTVTLQLASMRSEEHTSELQSRENLV